MNNVQLHLGDCFEILPSIPDESVDLILTDPPYNISQNAKSLDRSTFRNKKMSRIHNVTLDYGNWDKMGREEFIEFTRKWFGLCASKLKNGGAYISFFSKQDISLLSWIGEEHNIRFRTFFTWIKSNPMPSLYRKNYLSATESIFIGSKGEKGWTFNFTTQEEMHNVWIGPNKSIYGETSHPSEKPIALLKHFIKIHTNENDVILDCFMGSGSTGVACVLENRKFIGIEKDEKYFEIAKKRIEETVNKPKQGELF